MQSYFVTALALLGATVISCSSASATSFGSFGEIEQENSATSAIIKVHSRKKVHDMLHGYGYDRVVYKSKYYDDSDKPVYRFRACLGRRAFIVSVNWYGDIIDQYRAGRCHRHDW